MEKTKIDIPKTFRKILDNSDYEVLVKQLCIKVERIIKENDHYFFGEYTNHGIDHINQVMKKSEEVIDADCKDKLDAKNVSCLIIAILFHDIGMNLNLICFNHLISESCEFKIHSLDNLSYRELWTNYLKEFEYWTDSDKIKTLGSEINPKLLFNYKKSEINDIDRKFIGEFIRRNHPRIGHDLILNYFPLKDSKKLKFIDLSDSNYQFSDTKKFHQYDEICGIIARSHGMNLRHITEYLKAIDNDSWMDFNEVKTVFLMAVIRIADYLLVDSERVTSSVFLFKEFLSPISIHEFQKHLSVVTGKKSRKDLESYRFTVKELTDNEIFVSLSKLFKNIQIELDTTWAVLGEAYSLFPDLNHLKLSYRRISSNLLEISNSNNSDIVFGERTIQFNNKLLLLLARTLYKHKSACLRELVQNAADACRLRKKYDSAIEPEIKIEFKSNKLTVTDNGIGMSLSDISNYLLKVGRTSKVEELKDDLLTGKFGIGFLASFILSNSVHIQTRKFGSKHGHEFKMNINDDLSHNITIKKRKRLKIGTQVSIPISEENLKKLLQNINYYFDYSGEIKIENNLGLEFPKTKFEWRQLEFEDKRINWNYKKKHRGKFRLKENSHYVNNFLVPSMEISKNYSRYAQKEFIALDIIEKSKSGILNLSREHGIFNFTANELRTLVDDYITDFYCFLLSTKKYSTYKFSPSKYHPLARILPDNLLVYNSEGFNVLANINIGDFDFIIHGQTTIFSDIQDILKNRIGLKRILFSYTGYGLTERLSSEYEVYSSYIRSFKAGKKELPKKIKIAERKFKLYESVLNTFPYNKIYSIYKAKELYSTISSSKSKINKFSKAYNNPFSNTMIPYDKRERKVKFSNFYEKYGSRIKEMEKW